MFRIALANLPYPTSPDDSVRLTLKAIADAGAAGAAIVCFPECFVPGYRWPGKPVAPPNAAFLEKAWEDIAAAAARSGVAVVLGTERFVDGAWRLTALVIDPDGRRLGFQDKVQLDPSEDNGYSPASEGTRHVFRVGPATFGVVICHEGWRYPETVRAAVREGAQLVFHPHYGEHEAGGYVPSSFADPANTFHEKAALCRAAENGCFFATVNCAGAGSPTTSAVIKPDGTVLCWQPYGQAGLLVADLALEEATGLLAARLRMGGSR